MGKEKHKTEYFCQECGCKKLLRYLFRKSSFCFGCFKNTNTNIKISIHETFVIRDSLRLRRKGVGFKKFISEFVSGWFPSGDRRLKDGVHQERRIDKEKNWYDHVVKNAKTGKIIHEEHESLDKHNLNIKKYDRV